LLEAFLFDFTPHSGVAGIHLDSAMVTLVRIGLSNTTMKSNARE